MSGFNPYFHHWFALRAPVNREFKSARALQDRGLITVLPYETSKRRRNRHCRSTIKQNHAKFPRYVITGFPRDGLELVHLSRLLHDERLESLLEGVVSVTSDGKPSKLRAKAIAELVAEYGDEALSPPTRVHSFTMPARPWFAAGDEVKIGAWSDSDGAFHVDAFAGITCKVVSIRGEAAKVMLPLFGGEDREITVSMDRLEAA